MSEDLNEDEKKLITFAKDFIDFLKKEPKIRFNLHRSLKHINENLEYILAKI